MISQDTVDKIRDAAKVEEIVGEFVNLKRRGANMIGLCPFHNEKTPSFTISPSKNIYKCFGCGEAGDPISFLMAHEHYSYPESLRYLANRYGIEIAEKEWSPEELQVKQHRDSLHVINSFAQGYFHKQLVETDLGKSIGLSYFKERGYREETIRKFGLGYAQQSGKAFTEAAINAKFEPELLKELGLTTARDNDFFRGRVIFPIHNLSGKPIAFAGRVLVKAERSPKYLNSPESEVYHKSKIVYGIHQASKTIRSLDQCILVEGYTDVISLAQEGISNVVASSGTALTVEQVRLIKRFSPNLIILYDGDAAGLKAATRGLDIALEQDMNVRVVLLPDGEDPDSLVRKLGGEKMSAFLEEHAEDVILFKATRLLKSVANDPIKKAELTKDVVASIAKIPDAIKRSLYIKECVKVLEIDEEILVSELNQFIRQNLHQKERAERRSSSTPSNTPGPPSAIGQRPVEPPIPIAPKKVDYPDLEQELKIVQLLVAFGEKPFEDKISVAAYIVGEIEDVVEEFDHPVAQLLIGEVQLLISRGKPVTEGFFLKHPEKAIRELAFEVLQTPWELSAGWAEKWEIELGTQKMPEENFVNDSVYAVLKLKLKKYLRIKEKIMDELKACDINEVKKQVLLLQKQNYVNDAIKQLAEISGTVTLRYKGPNT